MGAGPAGPGARPSADLLRQGRELPRFAPDGSLLFSSARPDPEGGGEDEASAIWRLPRTGEAQVAASAPGGLSLLSVAEDGTMLGATSVLPGGTLEDDAERRKARKDAKQTTIWHTGMPIRLWDHEIGDQSRRLVLVSPDGDLTDLTPDVGTVTLYAASADLSPDGSTVATSWTRRVRGGETRSSIVLIDTATLRRSALLEADEHAQYGSPVFSRDGSRLAVIRSTTSSPTDTSYSRLEIHPIGGGDPAIAQLGDLTLSDLEWAADGTLLVAGDLHSSGAVLAIDPATGEARTMAGGGVFSSLSAGADGSVFALRSDVAGPSRPVRLTADGERRAPRPGHGRCSARHARMGGDGGGRHHRRRLAVPPGLRLGRLPRPGHAVGPRRSARLLQRVELALVPVARRGARLRGADAGSRDVHRLRGRGD